MMEVSFLGSGITFLYQYKYLLDSETSFTEQNKSIPSRLTVVHFVVS